MAIETLTAPAPVDCRPAKRRAQSADVLPQHINSGLFDKPRARAAAQSTAKLIQDIAPNLASLHVQRREIFDLVETTMATLGNDADAGKAPAMLETIMKMTGAVGYAEHQLHGAVEVLMERMTATEAQEPTAKEAEAHSLPTTARHWPEDRMQAGRQASFQMSALFDMLLREFHRDGSGCFGDIFLSTMLRIKDLDGVVTSVLCNDEGFKTSEMHAVVFGREGSSS